MPVIDIAGRSLHFQDRGTGFPLLLGHSYLWDSAMWAPQIEALSQSYRVIAPDLWGHGRSDAPPEGTRTLGDLAAQAGLLLDALGIRECAVVGLSVGGMWGAELALREPQRVRALVLMDTYLGAEPEATRARYFQMLDTIESLGRFPPPILDAVVPLFFRSGADLGGPLPTAFRRALEGFSTEQLRNAIVPLGRLIFGRPEALPRLAALDPERTLLMCGALDIPRPPAETTRMAELIGCEQVIVPDAGHISNLEQPAFVTRALEAWLERQIGR
jgi:pimeloyl-ACP methyl ester carboxylesterase